MKKGFKALHLVRPFLPYVPQVEGPKKIIPFKQKVIYTLISLFIFLVCSQLPLYGIHSNSGSDPFYFMRLILASNRGSVMELGISPMVTSGMVVQLLVASNIFQVDYYLREDQELLNGAQKLLGFFITMGEATTYVLSGMYGSVSQLGVTNSTLVIIQLTFAGIIILCLDEMLNNGYGLGSGISLFMASNICENVIWMTLSPATINIGRGPEFQGAAIALIHLLVTQKDKLGALKEAFYRQNLPNITNLLGTLLVFLIIIYFQQFQVNVPLKSKNVRGQQGFYPIKLFYTSNMPIILQSAFLTNFYFFSRLLYRKFKGNFIVDFLGKWKQSEISGLLVPIGGLAYYITPPPSTVGVVEDPLQALFYIIFMLSACAIFSKIWAEGSGSSAQDVALLIKEQNLLIAGHRQSNICKELNRYIPIAAAFGGICLGALTILADFLGVIGSGTGILLAITIIHQYCETFEREKSNYHDFFRVENYF